MDNEENSVEEPDQETKESESKEDDMDPGVQPAGVPA